MAAQPNCIGHFTLVRPKGIGHTNALYKCSHCKDEFLGSRTRLNAHIIGLVNKGVALCKDPTVVNDIRGPLREQYDSWSASQTSKRKLDEETAKQRAENLNKQPKIQQAMQKACSQDVHRAVARFAYANGIAFNVFRNAFFKRMDE